MGFGSSANCSETNPTPTLSITTAALRAGAGCTDTDNNSADFTASTPTPRNSASPAQTCGGSTNPYGTGSSQPTSANPGDAVLLRVAVTPGTNPASTGLAVTVDLTAIGGAASQAFYDDGSNGDATAGDNTFSYQTTVGASVSPGSKSMPATITDAQARSGSATIPLTILGATCTTIPGIQGSGNASPCLGSVSNIQGCITGIAADGFYFQDVSGDGNPATSDGMYVYRGGSWTNPSNWAPGDLVRVSGTVIEYYNTTEFQAGNSVTKLGTCSLPAPVSISPIADPSADPMSLYERYEGMRVQMSFNGWVVGPTKRFVSRFAHGDPEIAFVDFSSTIPDYGRVFESQFPGYQGISYLNGGFNQDLPSAAFGDGIAATNLIGVLGYSFDKYGLLVDGDLAQAITVTARNAVQDSEAPLAGDEFGICTFNVENFFDYINDGDGDIGDWNPTTLAEYQNMTQKRAKAIAEELQKCTVVGVEEVEGKDQVWADLASAVNALAPGASYAWDYYESMDTRDISVGILYDTNRVTLISSTLRQGCSATSYGIDYSSVQGTRTVPNPCASPTPYPIFSRPPYVGHLRIWNAAHTQSTDISVLVNHFKSKGSSTSCSTDDCTDLRLLEAQHVVSVMNSEYGTYPQQVTLGDLNDYLGSTPLQQFNTSLGGHPLVNLFLSYLPPSAQYGYIFNGESEVLDHFIMTHELSQRYRGGSPMHIDADFPDVEPIDPTTSRHASDHDPVFVRFSFASADTSDLSVDYPIAWNNGPHTGLFLGAAVNDDTVFSQGHDDSGQDDGVLRAAGLGPGGQWTNGNTGAVAVTVGGAGAGCLNGWIDWNADGDFDDLNELVIANQAVVPGAQAPMSFSIPANTFPGTGPNLTFNARFRVFDGACSGQAQAGGSQAGGEVEDYVWSFSPTAVTLATFTAGDFGRGRWPALIALGLGLLGLAVYRWRLRNMSGRSEEY